MRSIRGPQDGQVGTARPKDRRETPRYDPTIDSAKLGWWEAGEFQTAQARLQDISSGGAALGVDRDGPVAPEIWMCVATPGQGVWVQASVAAMDDGDGERRVRLAFAESCPYDVLKVAAWGTASARPVPPASGRGIPNSPAVVGEGSLDRAGRAGAGIEFRSPSLEDETPVVVTTSSLEPEAERSLRKAEDRVKLLPWVMGTLLTLSVVVLLGVLVIDRMGYLWKIQAALIGSK
jgi:hypothetical protein